jgi:cation transport ATPase
MQRDDANASHGLIHDHAHGPAADPHAHHHHHRPAPVPPRTSGAKDAEYTCPMHPQVRQIGPGHCPICGMALEPVLATAETGENPELRDMKRRFWIGLALTLPVFVLEMGSHVIDISHLIGHHASNWMQMVLATPAVLWVGLPFFVRGWQSLKNRSLNMFTLIALGTGAAWIYSMVAALLPRVFPAELRTADGAVAVYFEAAAVITVLVLLGQVLELRARMGLARCINPRRTQPAAARSSVKRAWRCSPKIGIQAASQPSRRLSPAPFGARRPSASKSERCSLWNASNDSADAPP